MSFKAAPTPNSGSAVVDTIAVGDDHILQKDWLNERKINPDSRIMLKQLSHVRYQHPDLEEINTFLLGMKPLNDIIRKLVFASDLALTRTQTLV